MSTVYVPCEYEGRAPRPLVDLIPFLQRLLDAVPAEYRDRVDIGAADTWLSIGYEREETPEEAAASRKDHTAFEISMIPYYEKQLAAARQMQEAADASA